VLLLEPIEKPFGHPLHIERSPGSGGDIGEGDLILFVERKNQMLQLLK
jgi:hypothetical protein